MTEAAIEKAPAGSVPIAGRIPKPLAARLRTLRRKLIVWLLVDGLGRVLWLLVGLAALDLLLDYAFQMDRAQRGVMLGLLLAGLAAMTLWRLVAPLARMPTDDALCLKVEDRYKQLGQAVISSLQLSRLGDLRHHGVSMSMVRATIQAGARAAEGVDFGSTLNTRKFSVNLALLAGALLVVGSGVAAIGRSATMAIWFQRNVLLGDQTWPQAIHLEILGVDQGQLILPRGEDWKQVVRVTPDSQRMPEAVYIDFQSKRGRPSQRMRRSSRGNPRQYEIVLSNVVSPFRFRARARDGTLWGRDAVTPYVQVELVDAPAIRTLRLQVLLPAYARGQRERLLPGRGPYYVLRGSSLRLTGVANKPLAEARLRRGDKTWPLEISQAVQIAGSVPADQLLAGQYIIDLTDQGGLRSKHPASFGLRIRPDRPPRLRTRLVGVSGMVVRRARIPISCRIADDFAVTDVRLSYQWQTEEGDAAGDQGVVRFDQQRHRFGRPHVDFDDSVDLQPLKLPTGATLTFRIEADDNDDVSGPKTGRSPAFLLRIVTEQQLRADLLRREKEQRQAFERLRKDQQRLRTDCEALAAELRGRGPMDTSQKDRVRWAQRRQKLIGASIATVAHRLQLFVAEAENNRLEEEGGPLHRRLVDRIIRPMNELAEIEVPLAEDLLQKARRLDAETSSRARAIAQRDAALGEAVQQQQKIANQMRQILTHMVKAEGFQEAVNLLYEIEKAQKNVLDLTAKELKELIRKILEEGGDVKLPNADAADKRGPTD